MPPSKTPIGRPLSNLSLLSKLHEIKDGHIRTFRERIDMGMRLKYDCLGLDRQKVLALLGQLSEVELSKAKEAARKGEYWVGFHDLQNLMFMLYGLTGDSKYCVKTTEQVDK